MWQKNEFCLYTPLNRVYFVHTNSDNFILITMQASYKIWNSNPGGAMVSHQKHIFNIEICGLRIVTFLLIFDAVSIFTWLNWLGCTMHIKTRYIFECEMKRCCRMCLRSGWGSIWKCWLASIPTINKMVSADSWRVWWKLFAV